MSLLEFATFHVAQCSDIVNRRLVVCNGYRLVYNENIHFHLWSGLYMCIENCNDM